MVMNKDLDIDFFVETVTEVSTHHHHHHHKEDEIDDDIGEVGLTDLFTPLEILNC